MFCVTTACVCSKQTGNFVQLDCVIRAALIFHTIRVGWQDIVAFHTTTSHYERNILLNNVLEKLERWSSTKVAMFSNRNGEYKMDSNKWHFALALATSSSNFSLDCKMSSHLLRILYTDLFARNLPPFNFHLILLCMSLE